LPRAAPGFAVTCLWRDSSNIRTASMETVLVIEDSRPMQRALRRLFEADSFHVEVASDGTEGLSAFRKTTPAAVILDLRLPGVPGRELCREFKATAPQVPIVVVSANSDIDDKVLLLELGADDYVTKPFSPKELLARVRRAMRRRLEPPETADKSGKSIDVLRFGDVVADFTSMEVTRGGAAVQLTSQELRLLKYFGERVGKVVTRDELLDQVWGYEHYPTTRTVDTHVLRLRQKLEPNPSTPQYLLTMHGSGYKFVVTAPSTKPSTGRN
jgi:DNA-binding response OmpR family regulator